MQKNPTFKKCKDAQKDKTRRFLVFLYGMLSIATYLRNKAEVVPDLKIVDLNIHTSNQYVGF